MLFPSEPVTFENGVHFSGWRHSSSQNCLVAEFVYPLEYVTLAERVVIFAKDLLAAYGLQLEDLIDAEKRHALPEGKQISIALWLMDKYRFAENSLIDHLYAEGLLREDGEE